MPSRGCGVRLCVDALARGLRAHVSVTDETGTPLPGICASFVAGPTDEQDWFDASGKAPNGFDFDRLRKDLRHITR